MKTSIKNDTIIVTGGAGFIGSNIVKGLNDAGETNIVVVDNLSTAEKHLNLNNLSIADFIDKEDFLSRLDQFRNVRTIFHQGACSSTTESDGKYMMKNNFEYSKILLHHALGHHINFLYASSASVYGNGDKGFVESRPYEYPLNVYAFSKFAFDNYVRRIEEARAPGGPQILGLRYFNVYGYQENHKKRMASVAFHLFHQLKDTGVMKLFEGSDQFLRDFIFVEDVVKINMHFYEQGSSGIYNAGTGNARSFVDIAKELQSLNGSGSIEMIPFPKDLEGKYQRFTEANLEQLRASGYKEDFLSLEEGVKLYFQQLTRNNGYFDFSSPLPLS